MTRVLVLIAAMVFLRKVVTKAKHRSRPTISPYKNALDGAMSAQKLSAILADMQFCAPAIGDHSVHP
jgi:hypothetical protein